MPTEDCEEILLEGIELVLMEDFSKTQKEVSKGDSCAESQDEDSWKESCLLRFSKFLGMSPKGYEDEILGLMLKISGRMLEVKGKGVHRTTKFKREIKRLEWSVEEKGGIEKGCSKMGHGALNWVFNEDQNLFLEREMGGGGGGGGGGPMILRREN